MAIPNCGDAGGGGEDGEQAFKRGFASNRVSTSWILIPIAVASFAERGKACPSRGSGELRWRRDGSACGDGIHCVPSGIGGARMRSGRASSSMMIIGAPQWRQKNVGGGDDVLSVGSGG